MPQLRGDTEAIEALATIRHPTGPPINNGGPWRHPVDRLPEQCNCPGPCRAINRLRYQNRISAQEWFAWHTGQDSEVYVRSTLSSELSELENDTMEFNIYVCARCTKDLTRSNRSRGKLEVPVSRNNQKFNRLCKICADSYYVFVRFNLANPVGAYDEKNFRLILGAQSLMLRDTGETVSPAFVQEHCFRSSSGNWFFETAARDRWDLRAAREWAERLDIYRRQNVHIFGYHETNNISLFGWPAITPRDSLCFGVELEMENRKDISSDGGKELSIALGGRLDEGLGDSKNRFILARDGSLDGSGLELITNPYTLEYHTNVFGWKELLAPAINAGACSGSHTTDCGMHVHVNRSAISPLTLGKALIFVNADNNRALIERIAQRPSNSYTQLRAKKLMDGRLINTSKYEATHLTPDTIEFRIFRGNLRADRILKNIEFCHSVFGYVATISAQKCQGFSPYLNFLTENAKLYPNLVAFLREKDTIAIRKGAPQVQISGEI